MANPTSPIGAGLCSYSCFGASVIGITIGALGLAGLLSLKAASIGALFAGPGGIIAGIIGLCGSATVPVVSGVALGSGLLFFMVGCCCSSAGVSLCRSMKEGY